MHDTSHVENSTTNLSSITHDTQGAEDSLDTAEKMHMGHSTVTGRRVCGRDEQQDSMSMSIRSDPHKTQLTTSRFACAL